MLKKIILENFKCFSYAKIPLKEMTIFAGANASGKSSVIQALLLAHKSAFVADRNTIDASSAMGIAVGNPRTLVSQNPEELETGDFHIGLQEEMAEVQIEYSIDKLSSLKLLFAKTGGDLKSRLFYLNAERQGPRLSYPAVMDDGILSDGSNAAYLIDRADMEGRSVPPILSFSKTPEKFSVSVENWMNAILGDVNLSVSTDLVRAAADIKYGNALVDQAVLPTMTGFGISYILSIVTIGLWCSSLENAVLIIENPEAHLHPCAQSNMGKFLELLSSAGVQVIIETHSEHIIDGVRMQAACQKITENVLVQFFACEDGQIQRTEISLTKTGELSAWPKGFFDQKSQDLRELFEIRRRNAGK